MQGRLGFDDRAECEALGGMAVPRILVEPPDWFDGGPMDPACRLARVAGSGRAILESAVAHFRPVRIYLCFSGGYDSATAVSFSLHNIPQGWRRPDGSRRRGLPPELEVLHVNTGIGIEATREYVRGFCRSRDLPFREVRTPISYEDWVLKHGFPGPGMHGTMYQKLKERAIRIAVREAKEGHRKSRHVLLISGIRHDESMIRAGYQRCVSKVGSQVWLNPLYWATVDDFRAIREMYGMPRNPVKDRLGMSGECLCGAYAERGELLRVEMTCPATAAYIRDLERRVREAGHPWGWEDPGPPEKRKKRRPRKKVVDGVYVPDSGDFRPMCASCEKTKMVPADAGPIREAT